MHRKGGLKRLLGWILSLAILLTSCFRPNYTPQKVDTPPSWRVETNEGSALCNFDWWTQFEDPVLNQLILIALDNNLDLRIAISRVLEYYARLKITNAALFPQVDGNASYQRNQLSLASPIFETPGVGRITNQFQASFNLNWELDFWGRVRSASEAAYADFLSQVEARRGVMLTVISSVANTYIVLRQLDAQLNISKRTLQSRTESLKLAQDRFEMGETSEIEVKQEESQVEIAMVRLIELERDIPQQENLLSILLGENPRNIERGLQLEEFQYPLSIPAGLPSDLLFRRPDILEAEDQLIAVNARVTQARALFFPQIFLTGFYGSQSDHLHSFLTSPAEVWQYGFNVVQTIFDAGRTFYLVKEVKAQRDQALFNYRKVILNAFREVNDALVAYQKNKELVLEHQKQVKVLTEYLHLAQLRYAEGEIDYLNVLDAQRELFDAELQMVQAQALSFIAAVNLYSALGGGWD